MKTDGKGMRAVKFMSLSSGSCGNCYYIGDGDEGLIVDAGVSVRKLLRTFSNNGLSMNGISGILVTHEHLDHIRFLGTFCKRFHIPVYTTKTIHDALSAHPFTSYIINSCRRILTAGSQSDVSGMKVTPFIVPHDASETVGYSIEVDGHNLVIMTDVGKFTDEALSYASCAETLVLESNYDVDMLIRGSYPYELKMRIMHGHGHLSNDECAYALKRIWHTGLKNVFLCHLSENNNMPELAYDAAYSALLSVSEKFMPVVHCLPRDRPSDLFIL